MKFSRNINNIYLIAVQKTVFFKNAIKLLLMKNEITGPSSSKPKS